MEPSTTNTLLSDHFIKALCNTLMHSLWQGILLAVITGAIVIFTKKASAAFRYNLLVGALTLFAFGVTATFIGQLQKPAASGASYLYYPAGSRTSPIPTTAAHAISIASVPARVTGPIAQPTGAENITETVITYFNTHHNTIVLIWFLIICAKSVQMAVGLHAVSHLTRTQVSKVGEDWENRLLQLVKQLHIEQTIRLMESGIAKVPMVVGHLKPVILIPIGLINSLTVNEVEAILIHELAHIRRRDYLVNLLQSFMEIVFFFNPAVLWISQLIKTERENCCDDLTIAQSRNKADYIRALVSCEEYQVTGAAYVMAFPGSKNTLLCRVNRIVRNRNYSLGLFEKTILAVCLVVMGLGISAFTARENMKKALQPARTEHIEKAKAAKTDTTVKKQFARVDNSAAPLSPFRHPAKPDTTKPAFDTSRAIGRELYRENLLTDTDHLSISLNERELIVNGVRMPREVHERIYRQLGPGSNYGGSLAQPYENRHPGPYDAFLKAQSEQIAYELLKENLVKDKTYFTYKLSRDEFSIDGIIQPDELRRRIVDEFFKPDDDFNIGYTFKDPGIYGGSNSRYSYDKSSTAYEHQSEEQQRYWTGQQRRIIDEMAREGLVNDRNNVSFTLTDKTFVINGLVQPNEIFQRYRQEYVPVHAGENWNWNYNNNPGNYPTDAYGSRDGQAYNRQMEAERQRREAETDKKLVADLLQDGLITDPNNVTFTLNDKAVTINGKKQSDEVYKKYKEKYMPHSAGSGWSWTYSHY
jgi:bla regulator protein BlaR1